MDGGWGSQWLCASPKLPLSPLSDHVFRKVRVCVPEVRAEEVVRDHHRSTGHFGVKRLLKELKRPFWWPSGVKLQELAQKFRRQCVEFQACEHPNWNCREHITPTPVPAQVVTTVALDIFSIPRIQLQSTWYNSLLLCVDRLSG